MSAVAVIGRAAVEGLDGVKVLAPAAPDIPRTGAHVQGAVHGVQGAAVCGQHAVDARVLLQEYKTTIRTNQSLSFR